MVNPFTPSRVRKNRRSLAERYFEFVDSKRPSDRFLFYILLLTLIFSVGVGIIRFSTEATVETPNSGGELKEGIIGSPRFVNPVLALTRADQDVVALLFDGLMEVSTTGELVPNIASSVTISSDATVYNIVLRDDVVFHDGQPLTADDVLFTIGLIQNPDLKSPLQGNFNDVIVEKIGEFELNLVLEEPYAPFIENLTVGILPHHEWKDLSVDQIPFSQHNTEPIGSGPYQIKSVKRNDSGLISGYTLEAFKDHHTRAQIETITISFFSNEETLVQAFTEGRIDSATGLSASIQNVLDNRHNIEQIKLPLPRTFALFFNQNKSPALRQPEVRGVLEAIISRSDLVEKALEGHGVPVTGPIPTGFEPSVATNSPSMPTDITKENIISTLTSAGWSKNTDGVWSKKIDGSETELRVDIATANLPFLSATAEYLREAWGAYDIPVSIRQFEQSDLAQTVIRTRDYEALLFGTSVGRSLDFYPFWHSSQRNDPGLNIALYANITADSALTTARTSTSTEERAAAMEIFTTELRATLPAIFLYVPTITTLQPIFLHREPVQKMSAAYERFSNIEDWYITTQSLWPLFNTDNN